MAARHWPSQPTQPRLRRKVELPAKSGRLSNSCLNAPLLVVHNYMPKPDKLTSHKCLVLLLLLYVFSHLFLSTGGPDSGIIGAVVRLLEDDSPKVRARALGTVHNLSTDARSIGSIRNQVSGSSGIAGNVRIAGNVLLVSRGGENQTNPFIVTKQGKEHDVIVRRDRGWGGAGRTQQHSALLRNLETIEGLPRCSMLPLRHVQSAATTLTTNGVRPRYTVRHPTIRTHTHTFLVSRAK